MNKPNVANVSFYSKRLELNVIVKAVQQGDKWYTPQVQGLNLREGISISLEEIETERIYEIKPVSLEGLSNLERKVYTAISQSDESLSLDISIKY